MSTARAFAKINLALVVGATRPDGKHEVTTVLQRIDLADRIRLERTAGLAVEGFEDDTLVRRALELAGVADRPRAVEALARLGRSPSTRAEVLAPPDFVELERLLA